VSRRAAGSRQREDRERRGERERGREREVGGEREKGDKNARPLSSLHLFILVLGVVSVCHTRPATRPAVPPPPVVSCACAPPPWMRGRMTPP